VTATVAGDRVRLEARDGWEGYAVVPAGEPEGAALLHAPGRATGPVVLELLGGAGGWRIAAATRSG
jgi:hypothetical protein